MHQKCDLNTVLKTSVGVLFKGCYEYEDDQARGECPTMSVNMFVVYLHVEENV